MDPVFYLSGGVVIAAAAMIGVHRYLGRERRKIANTPNSRIDALSEGASARITGEIVEAQSARLIAPFTGKLCVAYCFKIEEFGGKKHDGWRLLVEQNEMRDFFMRDSSGVALIRAKQVKLDLNVELRGQTGLFDPANEHEARVLRRFQVDPTSDFFGVNRKLSITETLLEVGETCSALGTVRFESISDAPDSIAAETMRDGAYRDAAHASMPVLSGTEEQPLLISEHASLIEEQ